MDEQLTFEFEQRPTIKGFPELRWTGKRPYRSTQYYPAQLRESYGEEQNGWINPKKRLPERGVPVLTYNKWGHARVETLRTWDEQPYFVGGLKAGTDVLFWRSLPQPPEVQ